MVFNRYNRWLRYKLNIRSQIFGLRFTTTWRCNLKCTTCSIWKMEPSDDLTPEEIDEFSRSKYFSHASYITLSGGEPMLRNDLPEVIKILHRNIPSATLNLTTNGFNPIRTEEVLKKVLKDNPKIKFGTVGLSLNGPREIHDETRGVPGSFDRVIETYKRIKDLVPCSFSFTFCEKNVDYFNYVQDFAEKNGTYAYICWTVMNIRFQVDDKDLVFWKPGLDDILRNYVERRFHKINFIRNLFFLTPAVEFSYLYDSIINQRIMPCYAGRQIVHIAPEGNVYPCNFKLSEDRLLGNLREKSFDDIWKNIPGRILNEIDQGKCMYPNGLCGDSDIYPSIKNNPPALLSWLIKKKLKGENYIEIRKNNEKEDLQ